MYEVRAKNLKTGEILSLASFEIRSSAIRAMNEDVEWDVGDDPNDWELWVQDMHAFPNLGI